MSVIRQRFSHKRKSHTNQEYQTWQPENEWKKKHGSDKKWLSKEISLLFSSDKKWSSKEISLLFNSDKKWLSKEISSLSRSSYDPSNVQKDLQKVDTKKSSQKYYQY